MANTMATTVDDLPADVLACALRRLDGPSLAADPETWRALCLASRPPPPRRLPAAPLRRRLPVPDPRRRR
jgi:hypothetical protein